MRNRLHASICWVGLYALILAALHGIFEILQGTRPIQDRLFFAIEYHQGYPEMWHAYFPAFSLLPNFRIAGVLVLLLVLLGLAYLLGRYNSSYRAYVLFAFSVALFLSGGGFVPVLILVFVAVFSMFDSERGEQATNRPRKLLFFWKLLVGILYGWAIFEWVLGVLYNDILLKISLPLFLFGLILPFVILVIGKILCNYKNSNA